MYLALPHETHAERLQHIEVVYPEQFEIVLHLGEQTTLDLHALRGDRERDTQAAQPIGQPGKA